MAPWIHAQHGSPGTMANLGFFRREILNFRHGSGASLRPSPRNQTKQIFNFGNPFLKEWETKKFDGKQNNVRRDDMFLNQTEPNNDNFKICVTQIPIQACKSHKITK